jgi:GTP-binding protein Era
VLAVNKIDQAADRSALLPVLDELGRLPGFDAVVPVSALTGDNVDRLVDVLVDRLPEGPRYFPPDVVTDQSERALAAELIREQLMLKTDQELPYTTAVIVDAWQEQHDDAGLRRLVQISATVHVERESQKCIVIGKGGQRIKAIGTSARGALERLVGCQVFLELFVRVQRNWTRDPRTLRDFGYE